MGGNVSSRKQYQVVCFTKPAFGDAFRVPYHLDNQVFNSAEEAHMCIRRMVGDDCLNDVNYSLCAMGIRVKEGFLRVEETQTR